MSRTDVAQSASGYGARNPAGWFSASAVMLRATETLCRVLLVALAYYVAGRFGLWLAIPPGYVSAVWPASGLALACLILLSVLGS